jgi:hypothetical protein
MVLAFIGLHTCGRQTGQLAIVTASRTPRSATVAGRLRFSSDYRSTAMPKDYQPLISQDGKGVLDGRCAHSLEVVQFTNGGERLACRQLPGRDSVPQSARGLLPARPGVRRVRDQDRDMTVLGERPARTGWVAAPLQPRIQLIQDGAAHLADLEVPERGA